MTTLSVPVHYIILFAEEAFERIERKASLAEARAYSDGLTDGANLYGAGGCAGYVMPDDEDEMRDEQEPEEVERALEALREERGDA